jgi:aspartate carbamoyltransferase catalytic subunit
VRLVGPTTLMPVGIERFGFEIFHDMREGIRDADIIMMLRVQGERMHDAYFPSALEYSRLYGLDSARMSRLPDHAVILHPGPMNRGMEISADVADSPRALMVEQVANGVSVRMAVLYLLLGGMKEND